MDWQTPDEIAAHVGPGGPVEAVATWIEHVQAGRFDAAWALTDPDYRRRLTSWWVERAGMGTIAADDLAETGPAHRAWPPFARAVLAWMRSGLADFDPETWGAASRPRPVGPDLELVLLANLGPEPLLFAEPVSVPSLAFLVRHTAGGWLVVGQPDD